MRRTIGPLVSRLEMQGILGAVGAGLQAGQTIADHFGGTKSLVTRGRKMPWNRKGG
jgi:hypothetical protein